jgi:serine protease
MGNILRGRSEILSAAVCVLLVGILGCTRRSAAPGRTTQLEVTQGPAAPPSFGDDDLPAERTIEGQIAIDVRDDASDSDLADIAATYGLSMRPNSRWSVSHDKIEVSDVDPPREQALLDALSRDPRVEHAEPMAIYRASFVPNDPLYASKQWHLQRIGAEDAWQYSCGRGVTVAIIDTGVACFDRGPFSRGTDLAGTRCGGGWNFVEDSPEAYDDHGHGTHVAGTIAQTTNNGMGAAGLAFCATLMPIKVLTKQGFGTVANVAEGIRFAADEGAQVINLSLGGPIKSQILWEAVKHALSKGVVVVAAAGNSGRRVGWPAAYPGVVAVSATDDGDRLAWFSSRGPEISIAAPGVAVTQQTVCDGGRNKCELFGTFNGTSMAAPHVAGVAAMLEALGATDEASVRAALESSARRPLEGYDKDLYGAGIVDAAAAAARVFWSHLALRTVALAGFTWIVVRRIRRRGGKVAATPSSILGALAASVGLFPIWPALGVAPPTGVWLLVVELAMRPFGEWDLVLGGVGVHNWLLLASALPPLGLAALGFANSRTRPLIGGVALGSAALVAQIALSRDVAFVAGGFALLVWSVISALLCLWLAGISLNQR